MSERTPRKLRYMKSGALDHERKVYANYFHDLIQNYGVDCTYFRHDVQFPEKLDLTPGLSGMESLIYGERDSMSYYLSGDMIVYIEVENDIFELNRFGLLPQENITMYFTVEDFNHQFATQLGTKKLFSDTISTTGRWNTATFNGYSNYAVISAVSGHIIDPVNMQTMMGWFKFMDISPSMEHLYPSLGRTQSLITNSTLGHGCELIYHHNKIRLYIMGDDGERSIYASEFAPIVNKWYHIASTHTGPNGTMRLYIDGEEVARGDTASINIDPVKNINNVVIGNWNEYIHRGGVGPNSWNRSFNGDMDDVRIYNTSLTSSEIVSAMNGHFPLSANQLVQFNCDKYDIDQTILFDQTINENHATFYGATSAIWDDVFTPYIDFVGSDVLSGGISTTISGVVGSTTTVSSFDVHFDTSAGYQIPINPYIHKSDDYIVSGGSYMALANGSITIDTVSSFVCEANVGVMYYEPASRSVYHTNIMPQVGDIFRMSFFDDNHEEFEITQIADKSITPDGISPLLGKYIWKCAAVRRVASYEDVIGGQDTEEGTAYKDSIQNAESWAIENITDTITDYTSGEDDIYGGYENDDPIYVPADDNLEGVSGSGTLFTFNYGPSYLATDEYNLYFINEAGDVTKLTDDEHVATEVPAEVIGMKYFRSDQTNLFFVNAEGTSWQLTDNFGTDPYLSSITDLSMAVRMPGDMPTEGMYLVLDNGMILFTDGINLFCINEELDNTQLTSN